MQPQVGGAVRGREEDPLVIGPSLGDVIGQSGYDTAPISGHSANTCADRARKFSNLSERFDTFDDFAKSFRQADLFGALRRFGEELPSG